MTTTADTVAEKAFEAALVGRPVPPGDGGLAAFTEAVRATATQPGRPSPALAELLATGLTLDRPHSSPQAVGPRRRTMWFAKIASAKVAAAGIVVAGVTGAGAAVVLPAAAPHAVTPGVETGTPAPDPERTAETGTTTSATTTPSSSTTESGNRSTPSSADPVPLGYDCDPSQPFGVCVSKHMRTQDGRLTPGQVDEWARYHQAHRAAAPQTTDQERTQDADTGNDGSAGQRGGRGQSDGSRATPPGQGHR